MRHYYPLSAALMLATLGTASTAVASLSPLSQVAQWNFSSETPFTDTVNGYTLRQHNVSHPVVILPTNGSARITRAAAFGWESHETWKMCNGPCGNRMYIPREEVPSLASISGKDAKVTIIALVQLSTGQNIIRGGAYVGGVWEEDQSWRQYAIFMDHTGSCAATNGLVAHISAEGGPSPGQQYCESRACGTTELQPNVWHCLANSYDGKEILAYVNGTVDTASATDPNNPFLYPNPPKFPNGGIFTPPKGGGANFSMGANFIHNGGGIGPGRLGNKFVGLLGAYSVYNDALSAAEIATACSQFVALDQNTEPTTPAIIEHNHIQPSVEQPPLVGTDRVEIAPGVAMPLINLGGVSAAYSNGSFSSNHTLWLELGGRGIDTALMYGDVAQKEVGAAVKWGISRGISRKELFVATKIPCCPQTKNDTFSSWCAQNPGTWDASANIEHDFEMLGVEYVDLMLLHWPCQTMEETVKTYMAMQPLIANGKARAIGVSNFNATFLEQFLAQDGISGAPPSINQCGYSIHGHGGNGGAVTPLGRDTATRDACRSNNVTYSAYSPLGGLSHIDLFHNPTVLAVASAHNKSAAQIALRWVVQQGVPAVTASTVAEYDKTDLDIFDFVLTSDEMDALSEV